MLLMGFQQSQFLPVLPCSGVPILHLELRVLLGRRMRRDGLGSVAFTAGLLHLKGLFQPKMVQWFSGCAMPREWSGSPRHSLSKAGAFSHCWWELRAAPGGLWDWHPVGTGCITLTHQSCHGAQQGDKCSAKHRGAKTEDVEEKRTFTFFTWRSKINMGTFPRRRACCGVDVKLQLLPVRYLQKHVSLLC